MRPDGTVVAAPVAASGATWGTGPPAPLFRGPYIFRGGSLGRQYDVAPDGRFLMLKYEETGQSPEIVLVQHWTAELERQVK